MTLQPPSQYTAKHYEAQLLYEIIHTPSLFPKPTRERHTAYSLPSRYQCNAAIHTIQQHIVSKDLLVELFLTDRNLLELPKKDGHLTFTMIRAYLEVVGVKTPRIINTMETFYIESVFQMYPNPTSSFKSKLYGMTIKPSYHYLDKIFPSRANYSTRSVSDYAINSELLSIVRPHNIEQYL